MAAVTVVVPSYNAAATIERCLGALRDEAVADGTCDVVVVDSSDDGTDALVRARFADVTLLRLDGGRVNAAKARNVGARHAREKGASIVVFVDADCVVERGFVAALRAAHDEHDADVVAGAILVDPITSPAALLLGAIEFAEFAPRRRARALSFAPSCSLSFRIETFFDAGAFPEEWERSHDLVLCHRYAQLGRGPILFEPRARVHHIVTTGVRGALKHAALLGRWSARVRRAHHDMKGSFLVDRPALLPLVAAWRYGRIFTRLLSASERRWLAAAHVVGAPLVLLGLSAWSMGFAQGSASPSTPGETSTTP